MFLICTPAPISKFLYLLEFILYAYIHYFILKHYFQNCCLISPLPFRNDAWKFKVTKVKHNTEKKSLQITDRENFDLDRLIYFIKDF